MKEEKDEGLEKIKRTKLEEIMRRVVQKPEKPASNKPTKVTYATFKETACM